MYNQRASVFAPNPHRACAVIAAAELGFSCFVHSSFLLVLLLFTLFALSSMVCHIFLHIQLLLYADRQGDTYIDGDIASRASLIRAFR